MPQRTDEFPCRTKQLSGARFCVKLLDSDGSLRMSTSFETHEEAEKWILNMQKIRPTVYGEITEKRWTETVCVECGQEVDSVW